MAAWAGASTDCIARHAPLQREPKAGQLDRLETDVTDRAGLTLRLQLIVAINR